MKKTRITVTSWTEERIFSREGIEVSNPDLLPTEYLFEGAQLNLLLCEHQPDGSVLPQHIVLEPDYLVDVTTICRCFTHHGDTPAMSLLGKFMPTNTSAAILLGNISNQFLDDCVNATETVEKEALYRSSLRRAFEADALHFATTEGIDSQFAQKCHELFEHIWETTKTSFSTHATLEAAFLCEALGIQGRMDLLSDDHHTVVEMKSGKAGFQDSERYEHAMQMALYKESLYYNEDLPYAQVKALLFYARYPRLIDIHLGRADIHRAIAVRNGIVHLERCMRTDPSSLFDALTEADFNTRGVNDRFYLNYLRPRIMSFLNELRMAQPLVRDYFHTMVAFVEREQYLAKVGIEGFDVPLGRGGFADTWRADNEAKLNAGRIIPDLQLQPIVENDVIVAFNAVTTAIDEASNFRVGDMVMLYDQRAQHPAAFYSSCIIERIASSSLILRLRYPQHHTEDYNEETRYAIEPAHADANYTSLYRGMFRMLSCSSRRIQLLLNQRIPKFDKSDYLRTEIEDEHLRNIILHARQARDYYLLVGPPGAGKTNVAMRQMVLEFASDILLTAFTNRAVDEICNMLDELEVNYVRLGPEFSCAERHRNHLLSRLVKAHPTRQHLRTFLQHIPIVVGTLSSITAQEELFQLRHFRVAIIDEASQVLEPQILPLWCASDASGKLSIDTFILIGDHRQLPAVVVQSEQASRVTSPSLRAIGLKDCRNSFFQRLHETVLNHGIPEAVGMLHCQGRMHQDICDFVSSHYYDHQLSCIPLPHQTESLLPTSYFSKRLVSVNVQATKTQCTAKSNTAEALCVANMIHSICKSLDKPLKIESIGIIVPFRGQITLVRRALAEKNIEGYEDITIDTVERFQGSQRDIIIFSTTVAEPWQLELLSRPELIEGKPLDRKLNVAITRARHQFILVGDHALLRQALPYAELIDAATTYNYT